MKKSELQHKRKKLSIVFTSIGIISVLLIAFNVFSRIFFCEKTVYGQCSLGSQLSFITEVAGFTVFFGIIAIVGIVAGAILRNKN